MCLFGEKEWSLPAGVGGGAYIKILSLENIYEEKNLSWVFVVCGFSIVK